MLNPRAGQLEEQCRAAPLASVAGEQARCNAQHEGQQLKQGPPPTHPAEKVGLTTMDSRPRPVTLLDMDASPDTDTTPEMSHSRAAILGMQLGLATVPSAPYFCHDMLSAAASLISPSLSEMPIHFHLSMNLSSLDCFRDVAPSTLPLSFSMSLLSLHHLSYLPSLSTSLPLSLHVSLHPSV